MKQYTCNTNGKLRLQMRNLKSTIKLSKNLNFAYLIMPFLEKIKIMKTLVAIIFVNLCVECIDNAIFLYIFLLTAMAYFPY